MKQFAFGFLVLYGIARVLETFWKREKIKGMIIAPYTLLLLVVAHVLIFLLIFWEWARGSGHQILWWISSVGMIMVLVSVAGRYWAIKTLGLYHSIHIEVRENHELIQSGPYKFVRNPYYLSNMVEVVGLPLVANAWYAMAVSIFLYIPLLLLRMIVEENALEEKFKAAFVSYKRKVPRVIPKFL